MEPRPRAVALIAVVHLGAAALHVVFWSVALARLPRPAEFDTAIERSGAAFTPGFGIADLLWSVSHLLEELAARDSLNELPQTDLDHIANDVRRVYSSLTVEWLFYCQHLHRAYPYIFSIVVRTHPLQESPSAVVT